MDRTGKLILGTVQFGLNYGINNTNGQVTPEEVNNILEESGKTGVRLIDTACSYGSSEEVLGVSPALHRHPFRIISKFSSEGLAPKEQYQASLKRLKVEKLYAYMVHNFPTYSENPKIWDDFIELKDKGLVERIGFSLYTTSELEYLLENNIEIDIVQVPYNILDRQFEPLFSQLHERGIEIHTRSAFLQGLFFKKPESFGGAVKPLARYVREIQRFCLDNDIQVQDLALGYVLSSLADGVLIGVDCLQQMRKNIISAEREMTTKELEFIRSLNVIEKELLSPVNW